MLGAPTKEAAVGPVFVSLLLSLGLAVAAAMNVGSPRIARELCRNGAPGAAAVSQATHVSDGGTLPSAAGGKAEKLPDERDLPLGWPDAAADPAKGTPGQAARLVPSASPAGS